MNRPLPLAPGVSPVLRRGGERTASAVFPPAKLLKQFRLRTARDTRLKPGANESAASLRLLPLSRFMSAPTKT